jgi:hypothetical protein
MLVISLIRVILPLSITSFKGKKDIFLGKMGYFGNGGGGKAGKTEKSLKLGGIGGVNASPYRAEGLLLSPTKLAKEASKEYR